MDLGCIGQRRLVTASTGGLGFAIASAMAAEGATVVVNGRSADSGIAVNVMSGVRLVRHYLPKMLARNSGRVIFMASESGITPAPGMPVYSATKTMQLSLARNLAETTKGTNVTVNAVLPGPCATEGVATLIAGLYPGVPEAEARRRFVAENRPTSLIQRLSAPQEVADFVTFLGSARTGIVNGAALRIDGGLIRTVF